MEVEMAISRKIEPGIKLVRTRAGLRRYEVRLKDHNGRWFPGQWFERLVDARNYKARLLVDRQRYKTAEHHNQRKISFFDYWMLWMDECRGDVSVGWKREQERIGEVYILPSIGRMQLGDVTSRDIGAIIERARAKGRSPAMLRHVYNVMHKAFEDAIEHFEFLERSPVIRRYCPKVPKKSRAYLHPNESAKLLHHVKGHFLEPAIMLGLMAGLRPSEIQALRWKNVHLETSQIIIAEAYKRRSGRIEPFPKQKDFGQATIPKPLLEYLKILRTDRCDDDFVAPGERGGMLNYHVLYQTLPTLCKGAAVKCISPHELRHSATELWVFNGATQTDVGRQLNHANDCTTERYMHRSNDRLEAIGESFVLPDVDKASSTGPRRGLQLVR